MAGLTNMPLTASYEPAEIIQPGGRPIPAALEPRMKLYYVPHGDMTLRVLHALSPSANPRGSIIFSPGRTEFIEKYLETVTDFIERGFNVLVIDPRGQGLSDRLLDDRLKSYVDDFQDYSEDFGFVIKEFEPLLPKPHIVMGHSMGGHGALVVGLRNPQQYQAISAFAPIANPSMSEWTQQAFQLYLGDNRESWQAYDATILVEQYHDDRVLLVDQGLADQFLAELNPDAFEQACKRVGRSLILRRHPGYDHGYYFISSFIDDHLQHHAQALR